MIRHQKPGNRKRSALPEWRMRIRIHIRRWIGLSYQKIQRISETCEGRYNDHQLLAIQLRGSSTKRAQSHEIKARRSNMRLWSLYMKSTYASELISPRGQRVARIRVGYNIDDKTNRRWKEVHDVDTMQTWPRSGCWSFKPK